MSAGPCCRSSAAQAPHRRRAGIAGWVISGAGLILLPKCPVCLAMYVALFTGVSISAASASHLRTAIGVLCGAGLFCLAVKGLRRAAPKTPGRAWFNVRDRLHPARSAHGSPGGTSSRA